MSRTANRVSRSRSTGSGNRRVTITVGWFIVSRIGWDGCPPALRGTPEGCQSDVAQGSYAMHETSRAILEDLFFAAIRSAEPGDAVSRALSAHTITAATRLHVISLGKAAERMAESALAFVEGRGIRPISGMIIAPGPGRGHLTLPQISGGHPIPDSSSFAAAGALEQLVSQVHPGDEVWVLLSGGATSLIAAPVDGVEPDDLVALYTTLLASGLDIHRVNLIRKRFSRLGSRPACAGPGRRPGSCPCPVRRPREQSRIDRFWTVHTGPLHRA